MNKDQFRKKGYCVVKSAISPELRDFITQYALFDEMQNFTPDVYQVPTAHSVGGDPAMETLLLLLQNIMEENTGLTLFPTYSFFRVYRDGDILHPHTDRPSCEISATLCFNYSYDGAEYLWPIYMENEPIGLTPGDMVIYRGCDLDHRRDEFIPPVEDQWQVQGFFHYVNANGPYAEYKYDKRESIGSLMTVPLDPNDRSSPDIQGAKQSYIEYTK
jgi:hypothetical protein